MRIRRGAAGDLGARTSLVDGAGLPAGSGIALASNLWNAVDLGTGPIGGGRGGELLIAKLGAAGAPVWSRTFPVNIHEGTPKGVAVDGAGNLVVVGSFFDVIDLGGGPLTGETLAGGTYMAKFDAAGNHVWSQVLSRTTGDGEAHVAAAPSGDLVVVLGTTLSRYSASGTRVWSIDPIDLGPHRFWSAPLAVDSAGNVILNNRDGGVTKRSPAGGVVWSRAPIGGPRGQVFDVAVDSADNVIAVGTSDGVDAVVVKLAP